MLLTSTLAINCKLRTFLNKATGIINFAKPFLGFACDSVVWCLSSRLDLGLSCAKDFWSLGSVVTWCVDGRRLLTFESYSRRLLLREIQGKKRDILMC